MAEKRAWNRLRGFLLAGALLYLIFQGQAATLAAGQGIRLCLQRVIPSLFPFFVLSQLISGSSLAGDLARGLGPLVEKVFHLPGESAAALTLGALGGYPTGARTCGELGRQGLITEEQGERLLAFCSNCSPGFAFGMLGQIFGIGGAAALYFLHLFSAVLVGVLFRGKSLPKKEHSAPERASVSLSEAVWGAIKAMASVCGYVVLFGVLTNGLRAGGEGYLPDRLLLILQGTLELTEGCAALAYLPPDLFSFCLAGFFLSFGGLCVWGQTRSVIASAGLKGTYYLPGKLLQGLFTAGLSWGFFRLFPQLFLAPTANMGNHQGLLASTSWVAGGFLLFFLGFALYSRKKAGKVEANTV